MDPITRTAKEFMNNWQRFRQSRGARLFRIDTDPSMHRDLWRLFRAIEMSPDNRAPYFIFDAPFESRLEFFRICTAKLASDYALVREGLAKDGAEVAELVVPGESGPDLEHEFALTVQALWQNVERQFEYLMLIFLPSRVADRAEWQATVERLSELLEATRVRIAVADTPDCLLQGLRIDRSKVMSGTFFISGQAVQDYMFKVAAGGWSGLAADGGLTAKDVTGVNHSPRAESKAELDTRKSENVPPGNSGANGLSPDEAARLRVSMAKAASASAGHKHDDAITALREARFICARNGLFTHEAIIVMAMANTFLAGQDDEAALKHYDEAIAIAASVPAPVVVMQARFGAGSTWFRAQNYDRAAETYEQASEDARAAESEIMRIEALRMSGACHNLRERPEDAIRCWAQALGAGSSIPAEELAASTVEQVGQAFVDLCQRQGLVEQATSVAQQVQAIKDRITAVKTGQRAAPAA
jgi:hypothetical protein